MTPLPREIAPAPEVSMALFWRARLSPKASVPLLTRVLPLKVLPALERVSVPPPDLVRASEPLPPFCSLPAKLLSAPLETVSVFAELPPFSTIAFVLLLTRLVTAASKLFSWSLGAVPLPKIRFDVAVEDWLFVSELAIFCLTVPSLMVKPPRRLLAAPSTNVPEPLLVSIPYPLMAPEAVRVFPVVTSIPPPPLPMVIPLPTVVVPAPPPALDSWSEKVPLACRTPPVLIVIPGA